MIDVWAAILLMLCGAGTALFCVFAGAILHMRALDRKLLPPAPKAAPITREIPAVKP